MLGKTVTVVIDRPIHSAHPEHPDMIYPVHYGYIENTLSPVDNEPLDAYVLGVSGPIKSFTGKVIAIIHRENEEDKLVVSLKNFSKEEIVRQTWFCEQYFKSSIEMAHTTKADILYDLKTAGFKSDDTLMIHSSLKSFGSIRGEDIIEGLKEYFKDGLIIFPTHTWAYIQQDNQLFDAHKTPSCVGALTNLAWQSEGFKRSMHPTHSVCAYGKNKDAYLACDLNSKTPVSPTGCFGVLKKLHAKIVFMGAPLSKNTFIHSIEEEMNVPDRFTEHIYHFKSTDGTMNLEYDMPRHYSTKSPHISDHYEKLLPVFLKHHIAYSCFIGNSPTIVVDAYQCYLKVKELLSKNIHLLDDMEEISDEGC